MLCTIWVWKVGSLLREGATRCHKQQSQHPHQNLVLQVDFYFHRTVLSSRKICQLCASIVNLAFGNSEYFESGEMPVGLDQDLLYKLIFVPSTF